MTSTPVASDAGSILFNIAPRPAGNNRPDNNFSDILKKQSQPGTVQASEGKSTQTPRTQVDGKANEKVKDTTFRTEDAGEEKTPEEIIQDAEKMAEELAETMLVQTARELGISVEEAVQLLDELNLTPMDLLQPENLSALLMAAGGETDSLALLTNENLYASLQKLDGVLQKGMEEIAKLTGMEVEDVKQLLSQAQGKEEMAVQPAAETEMPDAVPLQAEVPEESVQEEEPIAKTDVQDQMQKEGQEEAGGSKIMLERGQNTQSRSGDERHSFNGENSPNLFQQNLTNQVQQGSSGQAVLAEGYFTQDTEQIMNQIMDFMKIQVKDGLNQLELQLHPESLGTLNIHISSKEGLVTAQFTAQNETVKAALESQMVQLKESFNEQGVKVEAIEVTVQSHAFERNLNQGSGESGSRDDRQPGRTRTRRLNLEGLGDIAEEDMTPEDRLTAKMMEQNGNTVDYTA